MLNGRPRDGECLSVYGNRLVTSLISSWKSMNAEEIAVSVVLAHMAHFDNRLQRLLFTTNIKTRNELQQELKAFAFGKKRDLENSSWPQNKKIKLQPLVKCHFCHKLGHKMADCRLKKDRGKLSSQAKTNQFSSIAGAGRDRSSLTCFKCGDVGHIASVCHKNSSLPSCSNKGNTYEKRVDVCAVAEPTGVLHQYAEFGKFIIPTHVKRENFEELQYSAQGIAPKLLSSGAPPKFPSTMLYPRLRVLKLS